MFSLDFYLALWPPQHCSDLFCLPPDKQTDAQVADADYDEGCDDAADVDDPPGLEPTKVVAVKHLTPSVGLVPSKPECEVANSHLKDCRTDEKEGQAPDDEANDKTHDAWKTTGSPSSWLLPLVDYPNHLSAGDGSHGKEICINHHVPVSSGDSTEVWRTPETTA